MSFLSLLYADFILVVHLLGAGFFWRLGMFSFDSLIDALRAHFQKKKR